MHSVTLRVYISSGPGLDIVRTTQQDCSNTSLVELIYDYVGTEHVLYSNLAPCYLHLHTSNAIGRKQMLCWPKAALLIAWVWVEWVQVKLILKGNALIVYGVCNDGSSLRKVSLSW